ncbi:lipase family protein [Nocardia sp. BMG51109]|uniref:lipase family protein n=1 Tax=Nocardia sp. BMG51109 TaxID=1056816 RepID=UPI000A022080|nr:lipase family protein [Nocardia sp. BMG51109]
MSATFPVSHVPRSSLRRRGIVVLALVSALAAVPANAAPPPAEPPPPAALPDIINALVPPPPTADADPATLHRAVMPDPVGDEFFDDSPPGLDTLGEGQIVETREVTSAAAALLVVPVRRVTQLKFATTDAHGAPSFATATLAVPAADWSGPGPRPVVVNNVATDGLGRACSASYTLAHGLSPTTSPTDFVPPVTQLALSRGYAVLIPDHEGPRMAYAEPYVAGHIVLDAIRATRAVDPGELGDSRFGMFGYSGGAIATVAAAKLVAGYAPELATAVAGAAAGGVPADYEMLTHTMNGNFASSFFLAAVFGIARERPEILGKMNHLAEWIATSPLKNACISLIAPPGALSLPIDIAADITDPLHSPIAHEILEATRMPQMRSAVPMAIINGEQEFWIPAAGARALFEQQCRLGATASYIGVFGEHVIGMATSFEPAMTWLDDRLHGVSAPNGCPSR